MWKLIEIEKLHQIYDIFDWLTVMESIPQDKIYHAEGNVLTHTKMVTEALLRLPEFGQLDKLDQHQLIAAALMHDIEKRSTTTNEAGRIISPGHAKKGEKTVRLLFYKNKLNKLPQTPYEIRENIAKLVRLHGLPIWAIEKPNFEKELLKASLNLNTKHLYILAKADALGRICNDQQELLDRIEYFKSLCQEFECWGKPYSFPSPESKFDYFQKEQSSPLYDPFKKNTFTVTLMAGLPGAGKDTYIKKHLSNLPVISLDNIRRELKIKPTNKKGNGQVIQMAKEKARVYLRCKANFIWNATNITKQLRSQLINLFYEYGASVHIIYMEPSYERLTKQNNNRLYPIPKKVLEKMILKLEPPTPDECTTLTIISQK